MSLCSEFGLFVRPFFYALLCALLSNNSDLSLVSNLFTLQI